MIYIIHYFWAFTRGIQYTYLCIVFFEFQSSRRCRVGFHREHSSSVYVYVLAHPKHTMAACPTNTTVLRAWTLSLRSDPASRVRPFSSLLLLVAASNSSLVHWHFIPLVRITVVLWTITSVRFPEWHLARSIIHGTWFYSAGWAHWSPDTFLFNVFPSTYVFLKISAEVSGAPA